MCLTVIKHFKFIRMHNMLHKCFPRSSIGPTRGSDGRGRYSMVSEHKVFYTEPAWAG
jgi:hypothetical protein